MATVHAWSYQSFCTFLLQRDSSGKSSKGHCICRETEKIWAAAKKAAENDGIFTSKIIIKLPPCEYQYTPEDISGHPAIKLFLHSYDNTTGGMHTTIFCLFDLMVKILDDGRRFST
jgi:hypothetical protein